MTLMLVAFELATFATPVRPPTNSPPTVGDVTGPTTPHAEVELVYEVAASDRDNDPLTFDWYFSNGDVIRTETNSVQYSWPAGGSYHVHVIVDDGEPFHATTSETIDVTVAGPLASFTEGVIDPLVESDYHFTFADHVEGHFFVGARAGALEDDDGVLYWSWDGLSWMGPVLEIPGLRVTALFWDGQQFVLVGEAFVEEALVGVIYTAPDGRHWKRRRLDESGRAYEGAGWNGQQYVIALSDGNILVTDDLVTWDERTLPESATYGGASAAESLRVLSGHWRLLTPNVLYGSENGRDWEIVREYANAQRAMLALPEGIFVTAGRGRETHVSFPGDPWEKHELRNGDGSLLNEAGTVVGLFDVNGLVCAQFRPDTGEDRWHVWHDDTERWTRIASAPLPADGVVAYGAGRLLSAQGPLTATLVSGSFFPDNEAPAGSIQGPTARAARQTGLYQTNTSDPDGDTMTFWWDRGDDTPWVRADAPSLNWLTAGPFSLQLHAIDGRGGVLLTEITVEITDPLDQWTQIESHSTQILFAIALGKNGDLVTVGNESTVLFSDDGKSWEGQMLGVDHVSVRDVTYTGSHFIAVGVLDETAYAFRSADGKQWSTVWIADRAQTDLRAVCSHENVAVAGGRGGLIIRSIDHGATWTEVAQDVSTATLRRVTRGDDLFVAAHWDGIMTSPDGLLWSAGTVDTLGWNHLHWVHDRYINSGWTFSEGLWTSPDAATWSKATVVPDRSYEMPALAFVDGVYVAKGNFAQGANQLLFSVDGESWLAKPAPAPWSWRLDLQPYEGSLISVGNGGEIWRSERLIPEETVDSYEAWRLSHALEGEFSDRVADYDSDGWSNLIEYALWMKPNTTELVGNDGTTENPGVRLLRDLETGTLTLEYLRPEISNIEYQVFHSIDGKTWEEIEGEGETIPLEGTGALRVRHEGLEELPGVEAGNCLFQVTVSD